MRRRLPLALAALLLLALAGALAFVLDRRWHRLHEPLWTAPCRGVDALDFVTPDTLGVLTLGKLDLRDAATGHVLREVQLEDFPSYVERAFFRGGRVVASVGSDVGIWSTETGKREQRLVASRRFDVSDAVERIATATVTSDGGAIVEIRDVRSGSVARTLEVRGPHPARDAWVALSADGRLLLALLSPLAPATSRTSIWSIADGQRLGELEGYFQLTDEDELFTADEAPDGTSTVTISSLDGAPRRRFTLAHRASSLVHDIVLDARDDESTVQALDVETGEERRLQLGAPPRDFAVSRATNRIAFKVTGDPDDAIEVHELFP